MKAIRTNDASHRDQGCRLEGAVVVEARTAPTDFLLSLGSKPEALSAVCRVSLNTTIGGEDPSNGQTDSLTRKMGLTTKVSSIFPHT
jgi:hypothetical protein